MALQVITQTHGRRSYVWSLPPTQQLENPIISDTSTIEVFIEAYEGGIDSGRFLGTFHYTSDSSDLEARISNGHDLVQQLIEISNSSCVFWEANKNSRPRRYSLF